LRRRCRADGHAAENGRLHRYARHDVDRPRRDQHYNQRRADRQPPRLVL
jgi:hypothetical protein